MGKIVDTVEYRIRNAILNAFDNNFTPKIELAIRSINASSDQDATSVIVFSERGEYIMITAAFENVSERNYTLDVLNTNDETQNNIPDKVREFSVPEARFDRQSHTNNTRTESKKLFYKGLHKS